MRFATAKPRIVRIAGYYGIALGCCILALAFAWEAIAAANQRSLLPPIVPFAVVDLALGIAMVSVSVSLLRGRPWARAWFTGVAVLSGLAFLPIFFPLLFAVITAGNFGIILLLSKPHVKEWFRGSTTKERA